MLVIISLTKKVEHFFDLLTASEKLSTYTQIDVKKVKVLTRRSQVTTPTKTGSLS